MVLMCLDHVRDYVRGVNENTVDMATTTVPLFFTRWVTHFCAPGFVFLAGTAAYLASRRRTARQRTTFLVSRGLWLILLELTIVNFAWTNLRPGELLIFQVIWAIGACFLLLAALSFLPRVVLLLLGIGILAGQHAVEVTWLHDHSSWWTLLHGPNTWASTGNLGRGASMNYSALIWLGVMLLGYGCGPIFKMEQGRRRRVLAAAGFACLVLFVVVRLAGGFGNAESYQIFNWPQATGFSYQEHVATFEGTGRRGWWLHVIAFLNAQKYPPSLAYAAMTLGPILLLLAALDREPGWISKRFEVFGQVPLFYYVVHIYLAHHGSRVLNWLQHGEFYSAFDGALTGENPPWGLRDLWQVHVVWITCVVLLYPLCVLFGRWKRNGRSAIWSYV